MVPSIGKGSELSKLSEEYTKIKLDYLIKIDEFKKKPK